MIRPEVLNSWLVVVSVLLTVEDCVSWLVSALIAAPTDLPFLVCIYY